MERSRRPDCDAFTFIGFRSWKKVNNGKNCAVLNHVGEDPCSPHNNAVKYYDDLLNESMHIDKVMNVQNSEQILNNRLRVKTSIDTVQWLTFQGCPLEVEQFVLETAPKSAKYTSPTIQKEVLHVIASKVQSKIREDIGDSKFCIIVDESCDESKREQMALVLRFTDNEGFIKECFFDLSHVKDIAALTLKNEIYAILSCHYLDIQNIHGQGYDGVSNMCGEWKGLQALVLNDCPYAYYEHCFAHRLQLALVAASREVIPIHEFFLNLNFIITTVGSSCKHNDELRAAQVAEIARMLAIDELETGTGANQIGTLKRDGDSRLGAGLKIQLKLFEYDVQNHSKFQNLSSIAELCRRLVEIEKSQVYLLIDQLIHLVLTLPVSITTSEQAFSAMKIVKTRLRNKMEDEFLSNNLAVYIEREIAKNFTIDSILDDFRSLKERRLQF
nr:uncharacterized protein LOC112007377 [Quercus suber]